jgi:hypothetical protein
MPEKYKNSKGKLRLDTVPDTALIHIARAFAAGLDKYPTPLSWRVGLPASELRSAVLRHITLWWNGEENAQDTNVHHLAHAAAGLMMLLDLVAMSKLQDDRPAPISLHKLIYEMPTPKEMTQEEVKITKLDDLTCMSSTDESPEIFWEHHERDKDK